MANVFAWIDVDQSGTFDEDERADSVTVPAGSNDLGISLVWSSLPGDLVLGDTYVRIRITTDANLVASSDGGIDEASAGLVSDGEVEDHMISIIENGFVNVTKAVMDASGNGFAEAGEELTYTLSLTNVGPGVHDYQIQDLLDDPNLVVSGTEILTIVLGGNTDTSLTADSLRNGNLVIDMPSDDVVTVSFTVLVADPIIGNANKIANQAIAGGGLFKSCPDGTNFIDGQPDINGSGAIELDAYPAGDDQTGDGLVDTQDCDPTVIPIVSNPAIGASKHVSSEVDGTPQAIGLGDGRFEVSFVLAAENIGPVDLYDVQLSDDLSDSFGSYVADADTVLSSGVGHYTVTEVTLDVNSADPLTLNAAYTGTAPEDGLFDVSAGGSLVVDERIEVSLTIVFFPDFANVPFENQAIASGDTSSDGVADGEVTDLSDDGTDVDSNGNGDPSELDPTDDTCVVDPGANGCEDDPTLIELDTNPILGLAKRAVMIDRIADAHYRAWIELRLHNTGDVPVLNVQLIDDIAPQLESMGGSLISVSDLAVDNNGHITQINPSFNGDTVVHLLAGEEDRGTEDLPIGGQVIISFTMDFNPGDCGCAA